MMRMCCQLQVRFLHEKSLGTYLWAQKLLSHLFPSFWSSLFLSLQYLKSDSRVFYLTTYLVIKTDIYSRV